MAPLLGALAWAAVAAPIPMFEHLGCEVATTNAVWKGCASVFTVQSGTDTVPLCCDQVNVHRPDFTENIEFVPTAAIVDKNWLPGGCDFIVTYQIDSIHRTAWCALPPIVY